MTRYKFYMCLFNIWCLAFDYCLQFSVELGLFRWCVKLCARWANVCSMPEVVQCHLIWCALCKAFKALCKVFEVSSMVVHQVQKAGQGVESWGALPKMARTTERAQMSTMMIMMRSIWFKNCWLANMISFEKLSSASKRNKTLWRLVWCFKPQMAAAAKESNPES